MRSEWAVIVGNIGTVYHGPDGAEALRRFAEYCDQSRDDYGRAGGETVVLMRDDEPVEEFVGARPRLPPRLALRGSEE